MGEMSLAVDSPQRLRAHDGRPTVWSESDGTQRGASTGTRRETVGIGNVGQAITRKVMCSAAREGEGIWPICEVGQHRLIAMWMSKLCGGPGSTNAGPVPRTGKSRPIRQDCGVRPFRDGSESLSGLKVNCIASSFCRRIPAPSFARGLLETDSADHTTYPTVGRVGGPFRLGDKVSTACFAPIVWEFSTGASLCLCAMR